MDEESLTLKWGTLKGWDLKSDKSQGILQRYIDLGASSAGAMTQCDTPEQKQLICDLIDAVDGEIWNDWDGVVMTKEDAKQYVMTYGESKTEKP